MPLEKLSLKVTFFFGTKNGCMRAGTLTHPDYVILYRIPYAYAEILDSKRKADNLGYSEEEIEDFQDELKKPGVYVLIDTETHSAYIGKAKGRKNGMGLIHRMLETHLRKDDSIKWDIGFALTSKTEDLLKSTELEYLEWLFYKKAVDSRQYTIANRQEPSTPTKWEKKDAKEKLGDYIENAFNLLSCQGGCDVFDNKQERPSKELSSVSNTPGDLPRGGKRKEKTGKHTISKLHMGSRGADAYGYYDPKDPQGKRFIVTAGSKLAPGINECLRKNKLGYYQRRQELGKNGVDNNLVLLADETFRSISEAACVIGGSSLNGLDVWK